VAAAAEEEEEEVVGDEIIGSVRSLIGLERRFAALMHCCLLTATVLAAGLLVSSGEGRGVGSRLQLMLRWPLRSGATVWLGVVPQFLAFQNQIFCGVVVGRG
jgi:hypothetical protein